jgi:signal transduction histidine kinase
MAERGDDPREPGEPLGGGEGDGPATHDASALRAIDAQIKRLVRAEQQLYISQRALAQQLRRVHAVNRFAMAAGWTRDARQIFRLAFDLFFELFPYEQAVGLLADEEGGLRPLAVGAVEGRAGDSAATLEGIASQPPLNVALPPTPRLRQRATDDGTACVWQQMDALFGEAADQPSGLLVPLSAGETAAPSAIALRRVAPATSFHDELPTELDFAFVELMSQQISAALANAQLVGSLQRSYVELKQAQRALVRRERLAAIGELAALVAHEVRNPLGAIANSAALLKREVAADGQGEQLLAIVREETHRMDRIVSDLLDFARPDGVSPSAVSLATVVRDAVDSARPDADKSGVELSLTQVEALVARVDPHLLRRALLNLISNAVQSSQRGDRVSIELRRDGGGAILQVSDEGAGIEPGDVDRVFEPFFTTRATGTGLGLTVVQRFAEAHGGSVEVSSRPGGGTRFVLRIGADAFQSGEALGA